MDPQVVSAEDRKEKVEELVKEQEVHRTGVQEGPFSIHVLGLGKAGASVIEKLLSSPPDGFLEDSSTRFTALAVDIGDENLKPVEKAASAAKLPKKRSQVRTVAMEVPDKDDLFGSLRRYREYLKVEYPRYYWNPNYEPWLPEDLELPKAGGHFPRAVAKAIYNTSYYEGGPVAQEIDAFAEGVNASESVPLVFVAFDLADGIGSGIVVDVARHLSSIKLGRRHIVVGIGILPSDDAATQDGVLFPALSELDCMLDEEKNQGVMAVWGDLYKNPFTGGFFAVPETEYVDEAIVSFIAQENSLHVYETLKLLNWLNAPMDRMHPATRAPIGDRWVNMLVSRKVADVGDLQAALKGATDGADPEYVEARVLAPSGEFDSKKDVEKVEKQISSAVTSLVEPDVLHFDTAGDSFVRVNVPRMTKADLPQFAAARDAYDQLEWEEKLMRHSWLLDLGVLLCEPSIRFEGMGGECIWGCACWVVVPYNAIRGEEVAERV